MKIVFAGPSLPDAGLFCGPGITLRPPAVQGDILRSVLDGANVIGLIDGNFEFTAPVWHKEILYGLFQGVQIFGSSSMGALRAAECDRFGMIGIGEVYRRYVAEETTDDSDVALLHAPAELGYRPLTLPLVNLVSTIEHMVAEGRITHGQAAELTSAAGGIFYKERTWARIAEAADEIDPPLVAGFLEELRASYIDVKRADAIDLVDAVKKAENRRSQSKPSWDFHATSIWNSVLNEMKP